MWRDRLSAIAVEFKHVSWGYEHAEEVRRLAEELAAEIAEPVDREALVAAAYLHDAGALPPYRQEGTDHAARSAEIAPEILETAGFPAGKIPLVSEIIRGHMYGADPGPRLEARIFHDADTLEFLGAAGIARILAIVGIDDWTPDLPAAIALIRRFAQELPGRLVTTAGKRLGAERKTEMEEFLKAWG